MNTRPDTEAVETALRRAAEPWRSPAPRAGLTGRVLAELRARPSRPAARTAPPLLASAAALLLLAAAVTWFSLRTRNDGSGADIPSDAARLAAVNEQFTRWPEWVDRAADPYRREWQAVADDLSATRSFVAGLVGDLAFAAH